MSEYHAIGIELGSTRIKAVLLDRDLKVLATGGYNWENQLVDGLWSYALDEVWTGLAAAFKELSQNAQQLHGQPITTVDAIGVSAMMHGYLAFDSKGELLVPFRTWRNTNTGQAAAALTQELDFAIPLRWSVAHVYQAVLSQEAHIPNLAFMTTLAGYVHWQLTGEKVLGVGDASGMFPIDSATGDFDQNRLAKAQGLLTSAGVGWQLRDVLPTVLSAGQPAGTLTESGAALLDPTGALQAGIPLCPPEGDAGTGMVATNAVKPRTGNISAGTSIFAMAVLEGPLSKLHEEIDMVTTPAGDPVAMVHCNNGASEIDAWAKTFGEFAAAAGFPVDNAKLFGTLFNAALTGAPDGGGLLAYNYLAGEPITGLVEGRPAVVRTPDSQLNLPNLMRTLIMSSFGTLAIGMRILDEEGVELDSMFAHGGIFATPVVAQRLLAAAIGIPITVGATAAEGGAWGQAVLAAYAADSRGLSLADYLATVAFADTESVALAPDPADRAGFQAFLSRYETALPIESTAIQVS
jgi:sugar (pentulose or hexulose) kinase